MQEMLNNYDNKDHNNDQEKTQFNNLAEKAFWQISRLAKILERTRKRKIILRYSGHFKGYNANVKYNHEKLEFTLSRRLMDVDEDIQLGIMHGLIIKIFKLRDISTGQMDLYESFMKGLSKYAKKHTHDPLLEESFNRVNERFFSGMMDKPNLIFAQESFTKLGSYEYGTDTVYISNIFRDLPPEDMKFLDYIVYHELLHKKHTFRIKNGRHHAHTTAFREDERKFEKDMEEELGKWLRKKKYSLKNIFRWQKSYVHDF